MTDILGTDEFDPSPAPDAPYRALWAAVMINAMKELAAAHGQYCRLMLAGKNPQPFEQHEAWRWLHEQHDSPAGFVWVCQILNLDPARTRQKIIDNCHRALNHRSERKRNRARKRD